MENNKIRVAIYDYYEIIKLGKTDDDWLFQTLYKEVIVQVGVRSSIWFSLSQAAFAEYREYFEWQKSRGVFRSDATIKAMSPPEITLKVN